ncbi:MULTISPECIES: DEAD/DEAH box helicase [unclassified Agarivorans]|uniref:DEAD/DEAH box helicase n=1 Tax=unclassified Agarivorans TaxID=2636026 RepID=UPI0026E4218C|nr:MULTISPECIES: DEAD/DEAH box helicase family protein [unclassified Agarivorans]MDO6686638.1 DEAD/DEAH box helicase family protein [Agarivorans sp. 3_MG-2023]MDO6717735.1 DEAD/DEAH box helicase family protein [Agarivorans sp. 2_MG-2023]
MQLRQWQSKCIKRALKLYTQQNHFMCLATPGAGKTVMAAELARHLLDAGKIDFILCFSPSTEVNEGIRATFSKRLNKRFDGLIGSVGNAYTYQSMSSLNSDFWQLLNTHRVMVIMDEVHHLKGHEFVTSNAWGEEVLVNIQDKATFTLALSGTPWRSDKAPIVLSRFTEPDNTLHCDFTYGLEKAIADGVCRTPNIALIDNDNIHLNEGDERSVFHSFSSLLAGSSLSYSALLHHPQVMLYVLKLGVSKLTEIRTFNQKAGGLIVASSIAHAKQLLSYLVNDLAQSACLVTSYMKNPSETIEQFRHNNTQWIVSVGMIAEGTDIPRLQVCCHLSRIKTEMHYRQVLGRILRVDGSPNQAAWLFTLAEPSLSDFAQRIDLDLPETTVVFEQQNTETIDVSLPTKKHQIENPLNNESVGTESLELDQSKVRKPVTKPRGMEEENNYNLTLLGGFKEQIVQLFG